MNKLNQSKALLLLSTLMTATACGGGGGNVVELDNDSSGTTTPPAINFTVSSESSYEINEGNAFNSAVATLTGDAASGTVSWTVTGADASLFTVDSSTGVLTLAAQDFESPNDSDSKNTYQVTLTATDSDGNTASLPVTITILDDVSDNTGGDNTGGDNTGGDNTGGDNTGGDNTGGDNTGGDNTGGDNTGGDNTGGDNTGGDNTSGDNTGGDNTGGDNTGGNGTQEPVVGFCAAEEVDPTTLASGALYVSPTGTDTASTTGTVDQPFQTLSFALQTLADGNGVVSAPGKTIYVRGGDYSENITVTLEGSVSQPLVIEAYPCETPRLTGLVSVDDIKVGDWSKDSGSVYKVEIDRPVWQLFESNEQQMLARWPNATFAEPDSGATLPSVHSNDSWAHGSNGSNGTMNNKETDFSLASATDFKGAPLNLTGAAMVANVKSFSTFSSVVTAHTAGATTFNYAVTPNWQKNHQQYFVEGIPALIDVAGEWTYHFEDDKHMLYYWAPQGGVPSANVMVRDHGYAISGQNWDHVEIRGFDWFASALRCQPNCNNVLIEDNRFKHSATSRRVLKTILKDDQMYLAATHGSDNDVNYGGNQPIYITGGSNSNIVFRNNSFTDTDIQTLIVEGGNQKIINNEFLRLDYSAADTVGPDAAIIQRLAGNNEIVFDYNTSDLIGNSTMHVSDGGALRARYNHMLRGGYAQSDGASFQVRIKSQHAVEIGYNWTYGTPKYGIRFDAPFTITMNNKSGKYGMIHHNVVYDANGLMVKGDYHRIFHNSTWNNRKVDLRIIVEDEVTLIDAENNQIGINGDIVKKVVNGKWPAFEPGKTESDKVKGPFNYEFLNYHTIVANNASDSISTERSKIDSAANCKSVWKDVNVSNVQHDMTVHYNRCLDYMGTLNGLNENGSELAPSRANFNGDVVDNTAIDGSNAMEQAMRDPDNFDFRPKAGGVLHDTGEAINSPALDSDFFTAYSDGTYTGTPSFALPTYTEREAHGTALDLGAYELGAPYYWIPGRKLATASFPIPANTGSTSQGTDLIWRDAYQATSHHVYLSTSKNEVDSVVEGTTGGIHKGTFTAGEANIFEPGGLSAGTYYWRVDAVVDGIILKGDTWSFTVN